MGDAKIPDQMWQIMQAHLGYDDAQAALFRSNPRNEKVLAQVHDMMGKTIVFEVVESHGCNCKHEVGTRFFFSGDGRMLTKLGPDKPCAYALPAMTSLLFAIQELMYAGVDPNEMVFQRSGCFDVGVACGGWGRIVIEVRVVDRREAKALVQETER